MYLNLRGWDKTFDPPSFSCLSVETQIFGKFKEKV